MLKYSHLSKIIIFSLLIAFSNGIMAQQWVENAQRRVEEIKNDKSGAEKIRQDIEGSRQPRNSGTSTPANTQPSNPNNTENIRRQNAEAERRRRENEKRENDKKEKENFRQNKEVVNSKFKTTSAISGKESTPSFKSVSDLSDNNKNTSARPVIHENNSNNRQAVSSRPKVISTVTKEVANISINASDKYLYNYPFNKVMDMGAEKVSKAIIQKAKIENTEMKIAINSAMLEVVYPIKYTAKKHIEELLKDKTLKPILNKENSLKEELIAGVNNLFGIQRADNLRHIAENNYKMTGILEDAKFCIINMDTKWGIDECNAKFERRLSAFQKSNSEQIKKNFYK